MNLVLSEKGINELEKLKLEYPKYSEVIDEIIRLGKQNRAEAALMCMQLMELIIMKEMIE
jgi:hypothetical protein